MVSRAERLGRGRFGAHMSIAGGVHLALERGVHASCDAIQIFTKSTNQWRAKKLSEQEIRLFRGAERGTCIRVPIAHNCYLINLGSPDRALYRRSIEAFVVEMGRIRALGIRDLVAHPGAHVGTGEREGIRRISDALSEILERTGDGEPPPGILLETTAGQGSSIGHRFEQIAEILDRIGRPKRVGVCVDTQHIFAAGYEIRTRKGYRETFRTLDETIGSSLVRAFHLNDSKQDIGCRIDRHEHIGRGKIGLAGFANLVRDRRFKKIPMILETPKGRDGDRADRRNLRILRKLESGALEPG